MLQQRLKTHINTYGSLTVRAFQDLALFDATDGYYTNSHVIGRQGDFITSPEISQVFGEIIALSFINHWHQIGCPDRVLLAELGPGRGTLMADMIRTFKQFPDFWKSLSIFLVEICPTLMQQQKLLLNNDITHIPTLSVAPESDVTFIIANEFFDALPIEQFIIDPSTQKRRERLITYTPNDGLHFIPHAPHEHIIETSEASLDVANEIKRRLSISQGMALIIDYGDNYNQRTGDTLQAIYQHQRVSIFNHIGQADLSHQVDFHTLQQLMAPLPTTLTTQGDFLIQNGMNERTEYLAQKNPNMAAQLRTGTARLTTPSAMGSLFKVLTVQH